MTEPTTPATTTAPSSSSFTSKAGIELKKIGKAILAAITSPTAVKDEKSIATLVITRALIAAGGSYGLVTFILKLAHLA